MNLLRVNSSREEFLKSLDTSSSLGCLGSSIGYCSKSMVTLDFQWQYTQDTTLSQEQQYNDIVMPSLEVK